MDRPFEAFRYRSEKAPPCGKISPYFKKAVPVQNVLHKPEKTSLCSVCEFMEVSSAQTICSVCTSYKTKKKQQEFNTMEYLLEQEDLKYFSQMNVKIACASKADRPDFLWVLPDRVVILEVDENEHKYSSSATCEREREYRIADALQKEGKYVIMLRFNPDQRHTSPWKMYDTLGKTIRDSFATTDCRYSDDGILRKYIGYDRTRIRSMEREYSVSQRGMLQEGLALRSHREDEHFDQEWINEFMSKISNLKIKPSPSECIQLITREGTS